MTTAEEKRARRRTILIWTIALTLLFELITIIGRAVGGQSMGEWHTQHNTPTILRIHHMFWGALVFVIAYALRNKHRLMIYVIAIGLALIFSDLIHHFVYSPLVYGNLSWHWP